MDESGRSGVLFPEVTDHAVVSDRSAKDGSEVEQLRSRLDQ